jgi:hypothetical protein
MTVHIQADTGVVNDLLSRFPFTSYNSIVQARVELAQQIRLTMQHPQTYQTPIDQKLPAELGREAAAQYVHPWNLACALLNVCVNGARFGGDNLAPQEDLQVFVGEWRPLQGCTFPSAVVPLQELPKAAMTPPPPPAADAAPSPPAANPVAQQLAQEAEAEAPDGDLPDSSITKERSGQSGRPQKSPFEKKIEARSKIAPPPFWWTHAMVSAPLIFTRSPAGAADDSSTGAGPVQSYMVLVGLLQRALKGVDPHTTVAALRTYLREVDEQVRALETGKAANQLRDALVPKD